MAPNIDALFKVFRTGANTTNGQKNHKRPADEEAHNGLKLFKALQETDKSKPVNQSLQNGIVTEGNGIKGETEKSCYFRPAEDTRIETLQTEGCLHEVALPTGHVLKPFTAADLPEEPAFTFPFTLDPFQSRSCHCLERGESVLVSAHTSAGKTVIAIYCIAMSLRNKQRVVYTSPIKALSNQKFRELQEEFGDVGLMTGDVTINPNASCLVMTTEILRSMLYRGSEILREIAWVIFDEIHYMRDKERGVVWEETLIMLPDNVSYVFLSATIPNAAQFADWICQLHKQPCHLVYTEYRPTPLQHYIFPSNGDGLHLIVDEKGTFRTDNFTKAMSSLSEKDDAPKSSGGSGKGKARGNDKAKQGQNSDIYKIIRLIMSRGYDPVIVFSFSKRDCENHALNLSKLDFNNEDEKTMVDTVFNNAMATLSEEDRGLPQVEAILPLLKRGIGIHHSGLLPILKEVIEVLFQEGLIKALFATETFAMGLNMPARTVVFTSAQKFDGKDFRWLTGGEYIQMSGRAGRRGLDDRGIVILMVDEKMEPPVAMSLLKGHSDPLNSAFHLSYNMILNLLRQEEIGPEYMMARSFFQYQNNAAVPGMHSKLKQLEENLADYDIEKETELAEYFTIQEQLQAQKAAKTRIVTKPEHIKRFLNPGRLLHITVKKDATTDWGWAPMINYRETQDKGQIDILIDLLLPCVVKRSGKKVPISLGGNGKETRDYELVTLPLSSVRDISCLRMKLLPDLKPKPNRERMGRALAELLKRYPEMPLLNPEMDMGITSQEMKDILQRINVLQDRSKKFKDVNSASFKHRYVQFKDKLRCLEDIQRVRKEIHNAEQILQMEEMKARKRVLRRLGYITSSDVVDVKGRVSCEISTGDELLLTEMIFNGLLSQLPIDICVSLLSCFTFQEKSKDNSAMTDALKKAYDQMIDMAKVIVKVYQESKLDISEEDYLESFHPDLMKVVLSWCNGAKFIEILKQTDIFEGSIIRSIRRLEELLRQLAQAAKAIGNVELENKFTEGIVLIKRDIVFAASLYL
eukprot:Clim_evm8s234 gene=Clim_evmTU8s234